MPAPESFMTLRPASTLLGVKLWQLQRVFELGLVAEPTRIGNVRVVTKAHFPAIRAALIERGYLPKEGGRP